MPDLIDITHLVVDMGSPTRKISPWVGPDGILVEDGIHFRDPPDHFPEHHLDAGQLDWEALAYPASWLDQTSTPDCLHIVRVLVDSHRNLARSQKHACRNCALWTQYSRSINSWRPIGTETRESCTGCLLSHVQQPEVDEEAERDQLLSDYAAAQEDMADLVAERRYARTPADRKRYQRRREAAKRRVQEAARRAKLAGVDLTRKRGWVRRDGEHSPDLTPGSRTEAEFA